MSEVSVNGIAPRGPALRLVGRPAPAAKAGQSAEGGAPDRAGAARPSDRVELSDRARYLAKLREAPPVRQGLIDSVRAQIEAGTYDTPERLDAALDGLIEDLDAAP